MCLFFVTHTPGRLQASHLVYIQNRMWASLKLSDHQTWLSGCEWGCGRDRYPKPDPAASSAHTEVDRLKSKIQDRLEIEIRFDHVHTVFFWRVEASDVFTVGQHI